MPNFKYNLFTFGFAYIINMEDSYRFLGDGKIILYSTDSKTARDIAKHRIKTVVSDTQECQAEQVVIAYMHLMGVNDNASHGIDEWSPY